MVETRGIIANIPVTHTPPIDTSYAITTVRDTIEYAQGETEDLKLRLESLQDEMLALIKDFDPATANAKLSSVNYDKPGFGSLKQFQEIVLNTLWPTGTPIKPTLENFGIIDWSITEPIPPKMLEKYFSFRAGEYSSEIRAAIVASALRGIADEGSGLTELAHGAILSRERNARLRNQASATRDAMHNAGASGIRVSARNGQLSAIQAEGLKAQIHADQASLDLVTKLDWEYTVRAREFNLNYGIELEKMFSGEFDSSETRRFDAGKAEFDLAIEAGKLNVDVYREKWQGIVSSTQRIVAMIDGKSALNKNKTDQYIAELDGKKAAVDAVAAENSAKLQQRQLEIQTEQQKVGLVAAQRQENRADAQFDFQQELAQIEKELQVFGINLDGYKAGADLSESVLGTLSKVIAQFAASVVGIRSASASMGFNGGESKSHSISEGASLNESYSDPA
jgi:hypothetical protein